MSQYMRRILAAIFAHVVHAIRIMYIIYGLGAYTRVHVLNPHYTVYMCSTARRPRPGRKYRDGHESATAALVIARIVFNIISTYTIYFCVHLYCSTAMHRERSTAVHCGYAALWCTVNATLQQHLWSYVQCILVHLKYNSRRHMGTGAICILYMVGVGTSLTPQRQHSADVYS